MTQRLFPALALAALLLALPGCGFHPMYATHTDDEAMVSDDLSLVEVEPIPEHDGQILRNYLLDRFNSTGRPVGAPYQLYVSVKYAEQNLGTLANGTTTLAAIASTADYALKDKNGKVLATGTTSSTSQYDQLNSIYGTLEAHDSAIDRTMREISEQLTARIGLYFAEHKNNPAANKDGKGTSP